MLLRQSPPVSTLFGLLEAKKSCERPVLVLLMLAMSFRDKLNA